MNCLTCRLDVSIQTTILLNVLKKSGVSGVSGVSGFFWLDEG